MKYRLHHKQKAVLNANFAVLFLAACAEGGSFIRPTGDDTPGPAGTDSLSLSSTSVSINEGTIDASRTLAGISIVGTDYRLSINQTDTRFALVDNELIILEGAVFDYEDGDTVISIEVVAEKEGAEALRQTFTLTIENILPQFTSPHHIDGVLVSEASTYVYQPTHDDRENLTYSLSDNPDVEGDDAGYFTIDTATGALRFAQGHTPDPVVKSAYSVLITARSTIDGLPFEATQIFSINALLHPAPQTRQHQGTNGDDTLVATQGNDDLFGLAGNDILVASRGKNSLDGGTGYDTASYRSAQDGVTIDLSQFDRNTGEVALDETAGRDALDDVLLSIENLQGSDKADSLSGDWRDNVIEGGGGADRLDGRSGHDTLSYRNAADGVVVDLSAPADRDGFITQKATPLSDSSSDALRGFFAIDGSDYDDHITGDYNANSLSGYGGRDVLVGGAGNDVLSGGKGDDVINLQDATNANIVYRLESSTTDNTVSFTDGSDTIHGFVLSGSNADKLLFVDKNNEGMSMRDALLSKDITVGFTKSGADFTGFTLESGGETLTVNLESDSHLTGTAATALQTAIDTASITDITALLDNILSDTVFDITTDTTPSGINVL